MPKVSRSFALCISILPKPLNEQMMVSYLVYRIIDTIEDSKAPLATKRELFTEFLSLLSKRKINQQSIVGLRNRLLSEIDFTYEQLLLENIGAVAEAYFSQPQKVRSAIYRRGKSMADGMFEFQGKGIVTFADQNRYSHYVAGVIGYLFTDLLEFNRIIGRKLKLRLKRYARQFGLALQKVNILRDIAQDLSQNRKYWPSAILAKYGVTYENLCMAEKREAAMKVLEEHVKNAQEYLNSAMKYVLMLPKNALRVRMFCLIPLFMAIESYIAVANNQQVFDAGSKVKISREQVGEIVAKSRIWGSSNERLLAWFVSSMAKTDPSIAGDYARAFSAKAGA